MPKKKSSSSHQITASPEEIYFLHRHNVKVYPVGFKGKWKIQVNNNGKVKSFDKLLSEPDTHEAIALTIKYYCKLLKEVK